MTANPERIEQKSQPPTPDSGIKEIPESPEPSPSLQEIGVTAVPSQFTTVVTDDTTGLPLTQSPSTQTVTITIPASPAQLDDWSKGSPSSSLTWLATFWLRMVKKGLHFGWKVLTQKGESVNA